MLEEEEVMEAVEVQVMAVAVDPVLLRQERVV
jgi:hypothetical protein